MLIASWIEQLKLNNLSLRKLERHMSLLAYNYLYGKKVSNKLFAFDARTTHSIYGETKVIQGKF